MVVADRFHVAKLYRRDPDGLRKQEMKRLKKTEFSGFCPDIPGYQG